MAFSQFCSWCTVMFLHCANLQNYFQKLAINASWKRYLIILCHIKYLVIQFWFSREVYTVYKFVHTHSYMLFLPSILVVFANLLCPLRVIFLSFPPVLSYGSPCFQIGNLLHLNVMLVLPLLRVDYDRYFIEVKKKNSDLKNWGTEE